jgi:Fe-S-cluster containining protein
VKVSDDEIAAMAIHLGVSMDEFIERYTRLRPDRRGLVLVERDNGECVFLDGVDCRVHAAKPQQCRDFPERWENTEFFHRCQSNRRSPA